MAVRLLGWLNEMCWNKSGAQTVALWQVRVKHNHNNTLKGLVEGCIASLQRSEVKTIRHCP